MENDFVKPISFDKKKRILEKLNQGVIFEKFLHTKYIGQKRFSLEGGETTIAALDAMISMAGSLGIQEVVIGMAHRGRLNVLANIMGKTYEHIFSEFEGKSTPDQTMGSGDVKYHLGYGSEVETITGKKMSLKLMPNPSHLEAVDPVVLGFAKILQMSGLDGYLTGGTIHFVINNQIGFTTNFEDARTADYCTSLAAMVQAPVLHVNGDDPEAVVKCMEIATRYRQQFKSDVFIDMVCYRRHGHNEGDDPKFTQPQLYSIIEKHANPRETYLNLLHQDENEEIRSLAAAMEKKFWSDLQERLDEVKQNPLPYQYQAPELVWRTMKKATEKDFEKSPETSINQKTFNMLFDSLMGLPKGFKPLKKIEKLIQDKIALLEKESKVDWATAELLAYASLINEGKDVRMSGQDVKRGTFSHRHAVLFDENTDKQYNRVGNLKEATGKFRIFNSLLSEYGVLGFEYGYGMANPNALVLWEAQFGDFSNGAQTMIDQFISSAEQKWNRMNGLVMLLPHGYEGQGPEHSSARMERYLQMCAELNMVITNVTTASNFFHLLRRQLTWSFRKPLINFSPKANLRHPGSYSDKATFLKLCSGKIYFDLLDHKTKNNIQDIAIVRLEQIYPLPNKQLQALKKQYGKAKWFWIQEEPLNMGAASFLKMNLKELDFEIISRAASAATATGFSKVHTKEQDDIVSKAFSDSI